MKTTPRSGWGRRKRVAESALAGMLVFALPAMAHARSERRPSATSEARSQRPLEHTVGAMRSAELLDNAAMYRAIASSGSIDPATIGSMQARPLQARVEPLVGPASPRTGPELLPERESYRSARGGGPRMTQSLVAADRPGARGIESVGPGVASAPLGCSRIGAAGAPGVRRITLSVASRDGRVIAQTDRAGRIATVRFCPVTSGAYTIRARSTGGTVADPVQIFVE